MPGSKSDLPSRMTRRRLPMFPGLSPRLSLTSPDLRQSRLSQSVRQEDHSCSHPLGRDRERQSTCGGPPRRRGRYPFRSYRRSHTQPMSVETSPDVVGRILDRGAQEQRGLRSCGSAQPARARASVRDAALVRGRPPAQAVLLGEARNALAVHLESMLRRDSA